MTDKPDKPEFHRIYFEWQEVVPDPRQYKPSLPKLHPVKLWVALDLPTEHLVEVTETEAIINLDGFKYCIETLEKVLAPSKNTAETSSGQGQDDDWDDTNHDDDDWEDSEPASAQPQKVSLEEDLDWE